MSGTLDVGKKLVELCKAGKFREAVQSLYSPRIVSIEAAGAPGQSRRMEGLEAILGKNDWWTKNHDIHKAEVDGPWPNEDRFIVRFSFDVTAKAGPMAGKRMSIDEAGLYTVKDGKIVQEEFFYAMGT